MLRLAGQAMSTGREAGAIVSSRMPAREETAWPRRLEAAALVIAAALVLLALAKRVRPAVFEIAVLCFLIATPLVVRLPYKQYYVPWFVLAALFLPFLGLALRAIGAGLARAALGLVLALVIAQGWRAARDYARVDQAAFFRSSWALMQDVAAPEGRVIADPQWHPIYRRDVFYGWFSTFDPLGRGQEFILRQWNPQGYGEHFTAKGYESELRAHPPAIVVTVGEGFNLPATQESVERRGLARRAAAAGGVAASGITAYHDGFARR